MVQTIRWIRCLEEFGDCDALWQGDAVAELGVGSHGYNSCYVFADVCIFAGAKALLILMSFVFIDVVGCDFYVEILACGGIHL